MNCQEAVNSFLFAVKELPRKNVIYFLLRILELARSI